MAYEIILKKKAIKMLEKINEPYYSNIKETIYGLVDNPRPVGCKKLKGRNGYRIRVADYRVIYDIFDDVLLVPTEKIFMINEILSGPPLISIKNNYHPS